jgi:hypothetical protein
MKITGNPKLVVRSLRLSEHLAETIDQATAPRLAIEIGLADLESIDYDLAGAILNYRVAHHQAKAADDPCIYVSAAPTRPSTKQAP